MENKFMNTEVWCASASKEKPCINAAQNLWEGLQRGLE